MKKEKTHIATSLYLEVNTLEYLKEYAKVNNITMSHAVDEVIKEYRKIKEGKESIQNRTVCINEKDMQFLQYIAEKESITISDAFHYILNQCKPRYITSINKAKLKKYANEKGITIGVVINELIDDATWNL